MGYQTTTASAEMAEMAANLTHCWPEGKGFGFPVSRLGMSVTTQGGSGRQCVTGPGRNIPKYRFVLLNVYRFWET